MHVQSCCFARKTNCFLRRRRRGSVKRLKDAMGLFSRPTLSPTRLQKQAKIVRPLILRHDTFLVKDKCWQDKLAWAWVRI